MDMFHKSCSVFIMNLKKLSLQFSNFSMIFYVFSKNHQIGIHSLRK
jgi:hypothetical protein